MMSYNIAVVPLDGVGKEIHPLAVKLLKMTEEAIGGFELEMQWYEAGVEYACKTGRGMPDGFYDDMRNADAMFCGSPGHFDLEKAKTDYPEYRIGMIARFFRAGMNNGIGLRPLTLMPGVDTPLKKVEKIDAFLVRELTEGGYNTPGHSCCNDNVCYDVQMVTRVCGEKLAHTAYGIAKNRNGRLQDGKKMVTLAIKTGAVGILDFYHKIFREIAPQYADVVETQYLGIDTLCEQLIKAPERFDVVVCENMCGDIVGDIGACLTGGMGIAPTADIGGITPHFRPNHGTFPRAAGKNIANPIAAFMTAGLMLEILANDHNDDALRAGSKLIRRSIENYLVSGRSRTYDLGGSAGTDEAANAVFESLKIVSKTSGSLN